MGRLSGFKYFELIKRLRKSGFVFYRHCSGSHEIWRSANTGRKITIPRHNKDISEGTLKAILKEAGISEEDFLKM